MPIWSRQPPVAKRPSLEIGLERSTFTTLDTVNGTVEVTTPVDTKISDLEILFVGTSKSFTQSPVSPISHSGKKEAYRVFLRLSQPSDPGSLPPDQIVKAGRTHTFPFVFVIPEKLTSHACQHEVDNETVREAHLHLPPTFGDTDLTRQLDLPDDLAPDNTSVRYAIYARLVSGETAAGETSPSVIAAQARKVRIVPAHSDTIFEISAETRSKMRKEKTIHSGFMYAKKSGLVLEVSEPPALFLPKLGSASNNSISGVAKIHMRFDPADDSSKPPKPDKLVAILQTYTFFASTTRQSFPAIASTHGDSTQFTHSHHRVLSRRSVAGVEWKIHKDYDSCPLSHTDGTSSPDSFIPRPSKIYRDGLFYTAEILIPITLPPDTTFVPSFHSCMLSRIYSLELFLSMYGGITGSDMDVTIPVRILAPGLRERSSSNADGNDRNYAAPPLDEEESDFLSGIFGSRQNSVVGYGHHGPRLDALPAYSQ